MRPIRIVHSPNFPFEYTCVVQNKEKLAVRGLIKATAKLPEHAVIKEQNDLLTTDKLATSEVSRNKWMVYNGNCFRINGELYLIACETVFERSDRRWVHSWSPSANIMFSIEYGEKHENILRPYDRTLETYLTKWKSPEFGWANRLTTLAQIYVNSPDDTVDVTAKSITCRPNRLITNIPIDDAFITTNEELINTKGASDFLTVNYKLIPQATVKPNGMTEIQVAAYRGLSTQIATEVNYDGFEVEMVDGYCPHRRVKMVNGVGSFKVMALGLENGEIMRVKFGKKFYTGLAECSIKVQS